MPGYFVLKQGKNGKFHFNLKAGNHEVILSSEHYSSKAAAQNGIGAVQSNASQPERFEQRKAKDGQTYFVLKALNNEIIGRSELYKTPASTAKGIAAVSKNAATITIRDETA